MSLNPSSQEACQPGSCLSVGEYNVISNLLEKMDLHGADVVGLLGDFDGHGGYRAVDHVKRILFQNFLKHRARFSSNPTVAIGDLPAWSASALNEHQGAVGVDVTPICILFLKSGDRDVVAFEVETGNWVTWAVSFNEMGDMCMFNARNRDGEAYYMQNGETLLVKTSGHGDSPAADYALKQVRSTILRLLKGAGDMSILQKIFFGAMAVGCFPRRANAQQLTGNGNAVDPAAWRLTSDTANLVLALITALVAGGLGAFFIWKRFFPKFSVDAGLKASPAELGRRRSDLDSNPPRLDECY